MGQKGVCIVQNSNVKLVVDANTTNHPPILDDGFFKVAKAEHGAKAKLMSTMLERGMGAMTFVSPANGGVMTPEQWSDAKRNTLLAFGTARQIKFGLMSKQDWNVHVKSVGTARVAADKVDREESSKVISRKMGDWKKLATNAEQREQTGKVKGQAKPLQERVNIAASKILGTINTNAAKAEPDHLRESVKVKALVAELIQLTK